MPGGNAGPAGIAHCSSIVRMIMKDCHDESKANSKLCQVGGTFIHQAILLIKWPAQTWSLLRELCVAYRVCIFP